MSAMSSKLVRVAEVDPFAHGEPWRIFKSGPRNATVTLSGRVGTIDRIVRP